MTSARTRERLISRLEAQGITSVAVLDRIRTVPRHLFVDEALASRAYEDTALPIGHGQTISQPYVVARMTEALIAAGEMNKVLEIGTGCGYQSAVLAPLVGRLYSIERLKPLVDRARTTLAQLGVLNVRLRYGDGFEGWPLAGPFDGIVVTAAPGEIPQTLLRQLADGGCMIIPVGPRGRQELLRIRRDGDEFKPEKLGGVRFVPLLSGVR